MNRNEYMLQVLSLWEWALNGNGGYYCMNGEGKDGSMRERES